MKPKIHITKMSLGAYVLCTDSIGKQIIKYAERKRWLTHEFTGKFLSKYSKTDLKRNSLGIHRVLKKEITNGR